MKIYYTSSIRLNKELKNIQEKIKNIVLEEKNTFVSIYAQFPKVEDYLGLDEEQAFNIFRKSQKSLLEAEVVIADVSHPSDRIGFEIATAINEKKPVLALIKKGIKLAPPIQGNNSRYLTVAQYDGIEDVEHIVKKFIQDAKKNIDTKFILIISPQIDKYLEWVASERRKHKAQIVREALESQMSKDKEYLAFLKDMEKGN